MLLLETNLSPEKAEELNNSLSEEQSYYIQKMGHLYYCLKYNCVRARFDDDGLKEEGSAFWYFASQIRWKSISWKNIKDLDYLKDVKFRAPYINFIIPPSSYMKFEFVLPTLLKWYFTDEAPPLVIKNDFIFYMGDLMKYYHQLYNLPLFEGLIEKGFLYQIDINICWLDKWIEEAIEIKDHHMVAKLMDYKNVKFGFSHEIELL